MPYAIPPWNEAQESVTTGREPDRNYTGLAGRRHVRPAEIVGPGRCGLALPELFEEVYSPAPGIQSHEPQVMQIGTAVHQPELDQTGRDGVRCLESEISGGDGYDSAGLGF